MSEESKAKARLRQVVGWTAAGAPLTSLHLVVFLGVTGISEKLPRDGIMQAAVTALMVTLFIATIASWPVWLLTVRSGDAKPAFGQKIQIGLLLGGWAVIAVLLCIDAIS